MADGLILYETARTALAEAHRVDEVKNIRDKMAALEAYGRQTRDYDLVKQATEIRLRAERRAGELLIEMAEKGERLKGAGGGKKAGSTSEPALADLGVTKIESHRWQKMAALDDARFETRVEAMKKHVTGRAPLNTADKKERIAAQAAEIRREPPPLPGNGPYYVAAADVPWPYDKRDEDPSHRAVLPYPTMSIPDICAMGERVRAIMHKDSILWLWTTNHHMREAFGVLDAWGFEQITILTWVKDKFGFGDWLRGQTEHALFATRGKPIVQLTNESTVLFAPAGRHSEKPDEFYALVERLCPAPRYCELFARRERPNWDSHGDESKVAALGGAPIPEVSSLTAANWHLFRAAPLGGADSGLEVR
jgi:N6-adenosine-specific RNA methylase IME4